MELNEDTGVLLAIGTGVLCLGVCYKLYQNNRALEARIMHGEQRITGVEHRVSNVEYRVSTLEGSLKATQEALSKIYPSLIPQTVTVQPATPQPQVQTQYVQPGYASTRMPL